MLVLLPVLSGKRWKFAAPVFGSVNDQATDVQLLVLRPEISCSAVSAQATVLFMLKYTLELVPA